MMSDVAMRDLIGALVVVVIIILLARPWNPEVVDRRRGKGEMAFGPKTVVVLSTVILVFGGIFALIDSSPGPSTEDAQSPTSTPAESPSPESTTQPAKPSTPVVHVGQTETTSKGNDVTAYAWEAEAQWPIEADPGYAHTRADVEFCPAQRPYRVSDLPYFWFLEMRDGTRVGTTNLAYNGDELLGQGGKVQPGECVRGKVVFETPTGKRPRFILFSSSSNVRWRVLH